MEPLWKLIVPKDEYIVKIEGNFYLDDDKVLTLLYQPLIGPVCISLYNTLRHQITSNKLHSEPATHYYLMDLLGLNISEIYNARLKLEAVHLLETFEKVEENGERKYVYLLKPPFSAKDFFSSDLFHGFLQHTLTEKSYERLKREFAHEAVPLTGYKNVSKKFEEIFQSVPSENKVFEGDDRWEYPGKPNPEPFSVNPPTLDFELLQTSLKNSFVPLECLTPEVKDVILNLAFIYGIDTIKMIDYVQYCYDPSENIIDTERLREMVREWYSLKHYNSKPMLVDHVQSPLYREIPGEPKTAEERYIQFWRRLHRGSFIEIIRECSPR